MTFKSVQRRQVHTRGVGCRPPLHTARPQTLTIISALQHRRIRYVCAKLKHGSSHPCTQFLVSAQGFRLPAAAVDQTGCENVPVLYKTVITYGGPDVSNSAVDIVTIGSPI